MLLIYSIIILFLITKFARNFIKKNATILYILSTIISLIVVYLVASEVYQNFSIAFRRHFFNLFSKGSLATAGFVFVMYAGALPKGEMRKRLMSIRGELSIISSILILAHNISYGFTYFKYLFVSPEKMSTTQLAAAVISIILIFIMMPLFITSFNFVRKRMHPFIWELLQKLAYLFYTLIYVHVILILFPLAKEGSYYSLFNLAVYTFVFLTYFAMRTSRLYISWGKGKKLVIINYIAFTLLGIGIILMSFPR